MKTLCLRSFFLAAFFFCANQFATASHLAGGEISYQWSGNGNDYYVNITLHHDCFGVAAAPSIYYTASSASCGQTINEQVYLFSQQEYLVTCQGLLTSCNGGTQPGYEKCVYLDTISLPMACNDWVFNFSDCCRSGAITTLQNAAGLELKLWATLDNLSFPGNSSVQFRNDPRFLLSISTDNYINNGIFDPDGDSISITLADVNNDPTVYNPGYSASQPLTSLPPVTINSMTGDVFMHPTAMEVGVIVYKVEEFRNGQLIGSALRDVQFYIHNFPNQYPEIVNPNIMTVCANDSVHMTFMAGDLDLGDSAFHTSYTFSAPSQFYTMFDDSGQPDTLHLIFDPDASLISPQPYLLQVNIRDNHCPLMGVQQFTYQIFVTNCSNNVWPGDADADLTCDIADVLPIGLAYGSTGPVRAGASNSWVAQAGTAWGNTFLDYMHADCNGDGTINANDTDAISLNLGQTHPLRIANPESQINSVAPLYLVASVDSISASGNFTVEVRLGNDMMPVDELYGITFRLHFNETIIDSTASQLDVVNSWLGIPGTDLLAFNKPVWSSGYVDVAAVRTDQLSVSGDSTIAVFSVVIIDNVSTQTCGSFLLSNVTAINSSGENIYFSYAGDSVLVTDFASGIQGAQVVDVMLYPNPAQSSVTVTSHEIIQGFEIYNQLGELVTAENLLPSRKQTLQISHLSKGVYNLYIRTDKGSVNKILVK